MDSHDHQWQKLLLQNEYKDVVVNSLRILSNKGEIDVYAFVIMPNHIHLIWKTNGTQTRTMGVPRILLPKTLL